MTATVPEGHADFGAVGAHAHSTAVRVQVGSLRRPPAPSGADVSAYYDVDAAGSVRPITNDAGVTTARYDYLPFGERFNALAPDARSSAIQPRQYTGKEYDLETEFDYFGGRFYRPVWGRFTTVDPKTNVDASLFDPQRWNRYAYVSNTPLRKVDPTGGYEIDVHLYLTGILARAAGIDRATAERIAAADEAVDENPTSGPFSDRAASRLSLHDCH